MDAAPEPNYEALYVKALGVLREITKHFAEFTVQLHEAVKDLAVLDGKVREALEEAGADADEDGDEAGYPPNPLERARVADPGLEGCGTCTQFTPCPNPGVGCYVNPPAPDPCTACDDSDDEFCGYHSEGGLPFTHPCPGIDNCTDPECPCD